MTKHNREIEVKLRFLGTESLREVMGLLESLFSNYYRLIYGCSVDTYWSLGASKFARVRDGEGYTNTILTVKDKDRDMDGLDRLEIDLEALATPGKAKKFLTALLGRAAGTLKKSYYVLWDSEDTISAYQIDNDIYIEIETVSLDRLRELESLITLHLPVERAEGSLYEMYILKGETLC